MTIEGFDVHDNLRINLMYNIVYIVFLFGEYPLLWFNFQILKETVVESIKMALSMVLL